MTWVLLPLNTSYDIFHVSHNSIGWLNKCQLKNFTIKKETENDSVNYHNDSVNMVITNNVKINQPQMMVTSFKKADDKQQKVNDANNLLIVKLNITF